ncbi:MAG: hypothetical protein LBL59_07985 [Xanthomonadaceae bacterium]|nr:hypothetical protein [Xanthomonadaceae bacterium]
MSTPPPPLPLSPPPFPANDSASLYPLPEPDRTLRMRLRWLLNGVLATFVIVAVFFSVAAVIRLFDLAPLFSLPPFVTADGSPMTMWIAILVSLFSLWLNVIPHELGHALAGAARGMQLRIFSVGPLRIERDIKDTWRMRWGGNVRGIAGAAMIIPDPGKPPPTRIDYSIFILGGPSANLWTAALCFFVLVGFDLPGTAHAIVFGFGVAALVLGLFNLLPFQNKGWRTDGRVFFELFRHPGRIAAHARMTQLTQQYQSGIRPRDWPAELIPDLEAGEPSVQAFRANSLRLAFAADRNDIVMWREGIQWLVDHYWQTPAMMRQASAGTIAGFAAVVLRDIDLVKAWRPLCRGGLLNLSAYLHWLDAEAAALSGDADAMRHHIAWARTALATVFSEIEATLLSERIDALEKRGAGDASISSSPLPPSPVD